MMTMMMMMKMVTTTTPAVSVFLEWVESEVKVNKDEENS